MTLTQLSAAEAAGRLRDGEISSEQLVGACLERIAADEARVQAWQHLDADYALEQARRADEARAGGTPTGPLHGVPVGIKDIFDTRDMPTENGTPLLAERQPTEDATAVALLREAGAVILGKTVTTELAVYSPGKTRNPHNPEHTPGGSSSGSAAAVAAGMVPLALGSQTNGSVIRPASYCGVAGFKPSHGRISRHNVLALSRPLDTIGVFARTVEDLALIGDCLAVYDGRDPDMRPSARPRLLEAAREAPPLPPRFAFVKSPVWDQADEDAREAFGGLAELLGDDCDEVALPELFDQAIGWHRNVMQADMAKSLASLYQRGKDRLSDRIRQMIEEGQQVLAVDYNAALDWSEVLNAGLAQIFERYDAILTPGATGQAPHGLEATGDPAFCSLWTFCGTPAVSLPLLVGADGLPIGVQLVGARGDDARLLRTARALESRLQDEARA
jgi:Asp-tRNA(Asn)/Glu-tRNA(Gln) amidotransferase A subunit family amidase